MLAFITGSGFYTLPGLTDIEERTVETRYGKVLITTGTFGGAPVGFLPRHGADHSIAPHRINYRANIAALSEVGATAILATAVSGSVDPAAGPGTLRLIDQFIDLTSGRDFTFFDEDVKHVDVTEPYDPTLRKLLMQAAAADGIELLETGTYMCFNGPRFETPAEIKMASVMGADLVGMTGCPEVALANELGIPYAAVGVVSNLAAGMSGEQLSLEEIMAILQRTAEPLYKMFASVVALHSTGSNSGELS